MDFTINKMIKFSNKRKKQSGITLLESLISTAIIGIGFVAIFQMVNFSVQSIDSSSERTKANYLVSMIAEDIIAHKITDLSWKAYVGKDVELCGKKKDKLEAKDIKPIYETVVEDADENKKEKWNSIFNTNRYLKCKSEKDIKDVKIFQICKTGCDYTSSYIEDESDIHAEVYDEMFIGRVQVNMNDGKKRKFLYFTADYTLK
jgi:Tfp pilus assembly protein PilV